MAEYITLLGAEDVRSAASTIRAAADTMQRAASEIDGTLGFPFANRLEEFASRLENALDKPLRRVKVFKFEKRQVGFDPSRHEFVKVDDGTGRFHQWGVDYDEFSGGPGNYSTAIIEREDGTVQNVPAGMIQFMKDGE